MKKKQYIRKLIIQKIIGVCLTLLSLGIIYLAATGSSLIGRDVTVVLFFIPIGIYMIFTKKLFFLD